MRETALNGLLALRLPDVSPTMPSEIALLTLRLSSGDEQAFREFHAQYFVRLRQFLLVVARGDESLAQEALQETFLRVARHSRVFDSEEIFWCWLRAVARNAARDCARKQRRYRSLLERFTRQTELDTAPDVSLTQILEETISELEPEERQLIEGKYLDGDSVRQLSVQVGLTEKAVESRLLRLRRHLRERILLRLKTK